MKRFWFRKIGMIIFFVALALVVFSFIVMSLWNGILTEVVNVPAISFGQALGLLILSKILFGGFPGGQRGGRGRWSQAMQEKWQNMTPEERVAFKAEMRNRCGSWGKRGTTAEPASGDSATG